MGTAGNAIHREPWNEGKIVGQKAPESCVQSWPSADGALAQADPARGRHAAEVMGPSRSSEGVRRCYLVRWLAPD